MEIFFKILAVILAGVAAYFLWQGSADRAFIAAVFGAVSFFLSVRVQVKERLRLREIEEEEKRRREDEEFDEEFEDDFDDEIDAEIDDETPRLNEMPAREQTGSEPRTTSDALKKRRTTNDEQFTTRDEQKI